MGAPEHLKAYDRARRALTDALWELPAEFSREHPDESEPRYQFMVIKKSNVRKVHRALWELQQYFDLQDKDNK